jgi:hypothetical protein
MVQLPAMHDWPTAQSWSQPPQFAGSLKGFTQLWAGPHAISTPGQTTGVPPSVTVGGGAQEWPRHTIPDAHWLFVLQATQRPAEQAAEHAIVVVGPARQ